MSNPRKQCDHSRFCAECFRPCEVDKEIRNRFTIQVSRYRGRKNVLNTEQIVDLMVHTYNQGSSKNYEPPQSYAQRTMKITAQDPDFA